MSTHLLPVGSFNKTPIKYQQINGTSPIYNAICCEHRRMLYIGFGDTSSTFKIQKLNLLTNELSLVGDFLCTNISGGYYVGDMLVDDRYIYITPSRNDGNSDRTIYLINIKTLAITSYLCPYTFQGYGQMCWYNDTTIVIAHHNSFNLFDTTTFTWSRKNQSTNYGTRESLTVGKRLFVSHNASTSTTSGFMYRTDLDTFGTIVLPSTAVAVSCYNDGKFYIAQTNYLHIYDENTETIERSIVVPWTNPKNIVYTNDTLFVLQKNSVTAFIYDLNTETYKSMLLPWTVPSAAVTGVLRTTSFKGYFFIPYITLGIVNYTGAAKYDLGYKFDQYIFIYNLNKKDEYVYDDRFVDFTDSYVTIHDGVINIPAEESKISPNIKSCSIDKSQYTKFKSLSLKLK